MGKDIYKQFLKTREGLLILLVLIIGIGVGLNGLAPYVFGKVIDVISLDQKETFQIWIVIYIFLLLLVQVFSLMETLIGQWTVTSIENDMKGQMMKRITHLKTKDAEVYEKGELLNRIEFDVETVAGYYIDLISSVLMIILNLAISVYFVLLISWRLSLIAVGFLPVLYFANYMFRNRIRKIERQKKEVSDEYYSFLNQVFSGLNSIKAFGIQKKIVEKFASLLKSKLKVEMKNTELTSGVTALRAVLGSVMNVVLLTVAGFFIMDGKMTIGNMVAFNSYLEMLMQAVSKVLELNLNKQGVIVSYERITQVKEELMETKMNGNIVLNEMIHTVCFHHVSFSYEKNTEVLRNISFQIDKPGLYSFAGENGTGKTTILKLLERFYEQDSGTITVNNIPTEDYDILSLRNQISYMEKEPFFISGDVYQNLGFGNASISREEMEEACRKTGIHRDIMELDKQYRTEVTEGASKFSSGQKQKLGLARAILRNSSLYLLDEVTSDLDGAAEKVVCDVLEEIGKKAIVISVSHKEEVLKRSDQIFVLNHGEIVASGTHEQLLENSKEYQKLYKEQ